MFQQRYNRIALPLFFISDTSVLILVYFFMCTQYTTLSLNYNSGLILAFTWILPSLYYQTYDIPRTHSNIAAIRPILYAYSFFVLFYVLVVSLDFLPAAKIGFHVIFLASGFTSLFALSFYRFRYVYKYRLKGKNTRYAMLLAATMHTDKVNAIKQDAFHYGYQIVKTFTDLTFIIKDLTQIMKSQKIDLIFLMESELISADTVSTFCDNYGIRLKLLLPFSQSTGHRAGLDHIGGYPVLDVRHEPLLYLGNRFIKRLVDIIMASLSIIFVLTWLPLVVKIAQMISYPGPLFFRQKRIGRNGKTFSMVKFRTMYNSKNSDMAKDGKSEKTSKQDHRVPWFGKLLRRTNLDEYPQFLNVMFGSMSTVGPRPHMIGEDEILEKTVPRYRMRRFVKPGITGWAAVNGYRGGTDDMELMKKRTEYDIYYLENWSLWFDIKIIFITIWQMITFRIPKAY